MVESLIGFGAILGLAFLGIPLGVSMLLVGIAGFFFVRNMTAALSMAGQQVLDLSTTYGFTVLPLFVLMGTFIHPPDDPPCCAATGGANNVPTNTTTNTPTNPLNHRFRQKLLIDSICLLPSPNFSCEYPSCCSLFLLVLILHGVNRRGITRASGKPGRLEVQRIRASGRW